MDPGSLLRNDVNYAVFGLTCFGSEAISSVLTQREGE